MSPRSWWLAVLLAAGCLAVAASGAAAASRPEKLVQKSYAVGDVVVPTPHDCVDLWVAGASGTPVQDGQLSKATEQLVEMIVGTVAPASWQRHGGRGTIVFYPLGMSLVIEQTAAVHDEIARKIDGLRQAQNQEVVVEMRLVLVSESFLATFENKNGLSLELLAAMPKIEPGATKAAPDMPVRFCRDAQLRQALQAAQKDRRTNTLQTPRITLLDGQVGTINVGDEVQEGDASSFMLHLEVLPSLSADRQYVRLGLKFDQANFVTFQRCQLIQQTVVVPDGGTVIFGGFRVEETKAVTPMDSGKIPYIPKVSGAHPLGDPQRLFVMVTVRVVNHEEAKNP